MSMREITTTAADRQQALQRAARLTGAPITVICETAFVADWSAAVTAAGLENARVLDVDAALAAVSDDPRCFTGHVAVLDQLRRVRDGRRGRLGNAVGAQAALTVILSHPLVGPGMRSNGTANLVTVAPAMPGSDFALAG